MELKLNLRNDDVDPDALEEHGGIDKEAIRLAPILLDRAAQHVADYAAKLVLSFKQLSDADKTQLIEEKKKEAIKYLHSDEKKMDALHVYIVGKLNEFVESRES